MSNFDFFLNFELTAFIDLTQFIQIKIYPYLSKCFQISLFERVYKALFRIQYLTVELALIYHGVA